MTRFRYLNSLNLSSLSLIKIVKIVVGSISLLLSLQVKAESVRLQYGRSVPSWQRELLDGDLRLLQEVFWQDSDGELARIFGFSVTSSQSLDLWLSQRAQYIVDEKFRLEGAGPVILSEDVSYKLASPEVGVSSRAMPQIGMNAVVTMSNLTSRVFPYSRYKKRLVGINIEGIGVVPLISSQTGIFQIGAGLFRVSAQDSSENALRSFVSRVIRLRTLAHESRHGDGNGDNLGFPHFECPEEHEYAGLMACDEAANGPYRIGSLIVRSVLEGCQLDKSCAESQAEALRLVMAHDLSRVLSPIKPSRRAGKTVQPVEYDSTPEVVEVGP